MPGPKTIKIDNETILFHHNDKVRKVDCVEHNGKKFDQPTKFRQGNIVFRKDNEDPFGFPEGSVVITMVNPTCCYYYYGGTWWIYCY